MGPVVDFDTARAGDFDNSTVDIEYPRGGSGVFRLLRG
jgi:hypothetical protein